MPYHILVEVGLSNIWRKIKNLFNRIGEARKLSQGVLLPAWRAFTGETPAVSFERLIDIYLRDPAARAAVDFLADHAVGAGFYTTAELPQAKVVVDEFNENVNLDGMLMQTAREIVAFGNSFWEKIEPNRLETLQILPITSISKIKRDKYGTVQGYKQTIRYGGKTLDFNRIIHFRWNPVNGEAFGTGILHTLAESLRLENNETRPSYIAMKAEMENSMINIVKKYAGPTEIWKFLGLADEQVSKYASLIRNMPHQGARFVVNVPAEVEIVSVDPRSRFEAYVEHIWNQYILGLQTPLPKLFTTPGFTEASARAAVEIAKCKVNALQRFIKRIVEHEVFAPVIRQAGFNPAKANCRLHWGTPQKSHVKVEDMFRAFELGSIRVEELRKMLMKNGWELWETKEEQN